MLATLFLKTPETDLPNMEIATVRKDHYCRQIELVRNTVGSKKSKDK